MKKLSALLIIMMAALLALSAGTLPDEVLTVRAVGDYRKMTSTAGSTASVNKLSGAGFAFDYDYYLNNYVGLFTNVGLTVPLKSDVDGKSQDFEYRDFPVYTQFGMVGRIPLSNTAGLDLRLGFGVTYDKATNYGSSTIIDTSDAYYIIYRNYTISKVELQTVAGLGFYTTFDSNGSFGIKAGANVAATFYTGIYREGSTYSTEVADLKRVGYEVQPYVGFLFGFNNY